MIFLLRRGLPGPLRKPLASLRLLAVSVGLACMAQAAAQLKVGQPISFGSSAVGTSVTLQVVLSATGTTTISSASVLTDGATGQDFTLVSNACSGTIAQGSSCAVSMAFTPKRVGVRHGILLLYGSGNQVVSSAFLNGTGLGASFAFAPATVTTLASAPALTPATFTAGSSKQDGYGNLYFTDVQNQRILEQNATTAAISQVASLPISASSSIAIGPDGTLYVSAQSSVYAFLPGATPAAISTGSIALVSPSGLAVDSIGNLLIADAANGHIIEYSLGTNNSSLINLSPIAPGLSNPHGLALDASNNLYIADSGNDRIVEVSAGDSSISLLVISGLTLNNPTGIAVDPAGTIYVTDTGNSRLVELTVNGVDFVLSNMNLSLNTPTGVLIKASGDLVISDQVKGLVTVLRSTPTVNFATPTVDGSLDTTDGAMTLSVQATGNSVAQLVYPSSGAEPLITTAAFALTSAGTCPSVTQSASYTPEQFSIGEVCTYTIDFTPTKVGLNSANLQIDTDLPGSSTIFTTLVPLTGQGISSIASFSLVASPNTTTVGAPVSLTLTALNSSNGPAKDYVGTVTFTTTDSTGVFLGGTTYTFTAADAGVLTIPASSGIQFNQTGVFTVHATDGTYAATSNTVAVLYKTTVSSFTSSVNPSLINQSTTLSATITSTSTPIGGNVSFYNGSTLLGTSNVNSGIATLPVSFPAAGTFTLTATYNGDPTHATSSATLSQVVLNPTTATSFTSSVNPSLPGQTTSLTITLASSGPAPTGTVNFYSGTTLLGMGTVTGGVASLPVSFANPGTYNLSAVYSGDGNDATVTALLTQVVVPPVAITLSSTINPSLVNEQVTLTVTVTTPSGMPTGTVQIYDGATLLGTIHLAGGTGGVDAIFTTVGMHSLTAVYSGDMNDVGGTSPVYLQDVVTTTVSATFTSSVNPSQVNQTTTLTATLTPTGTAPLTGSVNFYNGTTLLGTGTVHSGIASLMTSFAAPGAYSLTAIYSGDTNNSTASAGPLTQVVLAPGSVILTSSVNPSLVNQNTTLTAYLGTPTATGTVNFYDGTTLLSTGNIVSGVTSVPASFSTVGIHSLTAVYLGDGTNAPATSTAVAQDVVTATHITSFTSSVNPSLVNQNTTLTLTLASTGGSPAPTGMAKFYNGTALIGTGTVTGGVGMLTTSFAVIGSYPLTAVYSGDNYNAAITAGPLTQVVVAPGSVVLTSSINPSLTGQSTTLTAYMGSPTAGGTVGFYDGTTLLSTRSVNGGVATLPISFSTAGIHSLTAQYSGDANDASATSAIYLQDVVNPTTVTSFTSSVNPSLVGQSTMLAVTFTSASTSIAGIVTFYDGTTLIGTGTVSNGAASIPVSFATAGTHSLAAIYSGDTTNSTITAGPLAQIVLNSTTVVLSSSVNPSLVSANTTLTATLGSSLAVGTVSFYDGATLLGTKNVSGGAATLPVSFSTAGIHSLTARYSGDTTDAPMTSAVYLQDVQSPTLAASFTSSVNPSLVNQSTTLTATFTPTGTALLTGTVNFYNGTTLLGARTINSGVATLPISFSAVGSYTLTAVYVGDTNNTPVTVGPLTQVVVAPGSVVLTSSINPSLVTQSTTLTAYLGTTTATGMVSFYDGTTLLAATNIITNGVASITPSFSTVGIHSLTAVYSGDPNNAGATSPILAQDVVTTTHINSFTSSVNPSLVNQSTTLTLTLASTGGSPAPTGMVKFYSGTTLLGTGTLNGGVAFVATSFAAIGSYPLTAVYSGDNYNATITAGPLTQVVVAPGSVVLTSTINPSLTGQSTTLNAYVGSPTAGGTISFYDGATLLGTRNVAGGVATLPVSFSTAGIHSLTAQYSGDANDASATSPVYSQDVQNTDTASLSSPAAPIATGQSVTLTATILSTAPGGAGTASGIVQFYNGGVLIGAGTVTGGVATLITSFSTPGSQSLTCKYTGDNYFEANVCAAFGLTVQNASTVNLTSSLNPSIFNQSVTFTATVVSAGPTPTVSVNFYNGTTLLATVPLPANSNIATYTTSTLPIGTDTIKAAYSGDGNTSAASNTLLQVVLNPASITFNCPTSIVLVNTATTLTATVTSTGPAPTGSVSFYSGTTLLGTGKLLGGVATISATFPAIGPQSLTAVYSGDNNDGTVTSTPCTTPVVDAASITLTSSPNPSVVQQSVNFTATISASGPTPMGMVKFYSGTTLLGTANVISGAASLPYAFPLAGTYSITAVYSGDNNTEPITTPTPLAQVVLNIATLMLTSATNPILLDNQDLLTVTVTSTGVTPTGTVTFFDGAAPLGNAILVNGVATLMASFPVSGAQSLTAKYYGDAITAPATSPAVSETVGDIAVAVATGTPNSATILAGGTATYSLVLTPLITATLPSTVSFSVSGLPTGATYSFAPASVAAGSATTPFTLTINAPAITAELREAPHRGNHIAPVAAALLLLPLAFAGRRKLARTRHKLGSLLLLLLLAAGATGLTGCITAASSGYYGQTVQTYNITVTASSGHLSRTTGVTLIVQ